jgi:hypothetical protein
MSVCSLASNSHFDLVVWTYYTLCSSRYKQERNITNRNILCRRIRISVLFYIPHVRIRISAFLLYSGYIRHKMNLLHSSTASASIPPLYTHHSHDTKAR